MTPFESQKTDAITLFDDETVFAFLGEGDPACFHCLDCCLNLGFTQVSSMVTNLSKNSCGSALNSTKQSREIS